MGVQTNMSDFPTGSSMDTPRSGTLSLQEPPVGHRDKFRLESPQNSYVRSEELKTGRIKKGT